MIPVAFTDAELVATHMAVFNVLHEFRTFAGLTDPEYKETYEAYHTIHVKLLEQMRQRGLKITTCTGCMTKVPEW